MRRYQINYRWLIGVFAGGFVLAVLAFFTQRWQVGRKAGIFITKAEASLAEGKPLEAFDSFYKYVQLRPEEDEARIKMATVAVDVIKGLQFAPEERSRAYAVLDQAVRTTNDSKLRRELAEIMLLFNRPQDSIRHLEDLLANAPKDSELNALLVKSLYQATEFKRLKSKAFNLIGYDAKTAAFIPEKLVLKGEPDVYALLSKVILKIDGDSDLARRVIDQMALDNPDSAQAYFQKSVFLVTQGDFEAAKFLDKAYELDPSDAAILTQKGTTALYGLLYRKAKSAYLKAMTDYEEAVTQHESQDSRELENPQYKEAKATYLKAISNFEASHPAYEEAVDKYTEAKAKYENAVSQIAPKNNAALTGTEYSESLADFYQAKATFEAAMPNYEKAKEFFAQGLKEHPDNVLLYQLVAEAESRMKHYDAAIKILDEGIGRFEKFQHISLILYKLNLLFAEKDFASIKDEIKSLTQMHTPSLQPIIDFQRARMLVAKKEWAAAAKELKRIRPLIYARPRYQQLAGILLGSCYEQQGIYDLAREAYSLVAVEYPEHRPAQAGLARMDARLQPKKRTGFEFDQIVTAMLEAPEAEQDWDKIDKLLDKAIAGHELSEARKLILRAKVLVRRGKFAEAKRLIRDANKAATDEEAMDIFFEAVLLVLADPDEGPATALKLLDRLEKKFGRSLRSLAQRVELLVLLNSEDVSVQLRSLAAAAASDITESEQTRLNKIIGYKFDQLGKFDDAREFLEQIAIQEPNNLPIRMRLFDISLRQGNDAEMQKAQEAILKVIGSKDNPSYILNELKRRITHFNQGKIDKAELASIRESLDTALRQRPEWHELHIAYGQFLLYMDGEMDLALKHFDQALEFGPAKFSVVALQVRLLAERGLYSQARERMGRLSKSHRRQLLGKLEAEVLMKTGDVEKGFRVAKELAASQAKKPKTLTWFSVIAQQSGKIDDAIASLSSALELNPASPDDWLRLVSLYAGQKNFEKVVDVVREAHLYSDAEFLPLLSAKYYERTSRWRSAESIYLAAYADQLEEPSVSQRLAAFYLRWTKQDKANVGRSAVYINKILKAANDGVVAADNPHVVWARQAAAKILFAQKDYRQSLKAERLLRQSAVNSTMNEAESQLLVNILIARGNPQALLQAIELLAEQHKSGRLPLKGALRLVRLLSRTNQRDQSQELILQLIANHKSDPTIRATYIDLLIDHEEYANAERSLKRLQAMDPKNASLVQLSARIASERGDQVELNRLLVSLLPKLKGKMTEPQLKQALSIAQLATLYGDLELAEKLYRVSVQRSPDLLFQLTKFLAYHGNCDEALEHMKRLYADQTDNVVQLASYMAKARRDEFGDKYDEQVDRLIDAALREDPDSISRQLARAETYEIQGKNEQSIAAYDRLLSRDDLPVRVRAAAMNNLGFQLALLNQRVDEAEQLINDAMETFGPVEDMLDTRAIVRIAQKKYDLAIKDMELALSVSRDPIKYFHLARAYILAGDGQSASKAWKKAQELGFEKNALPRLEKETFEQILQQIENFQAQSAKL